MSVLHYGGNAGCATPVVVKMCVLVGEKLHLVWGHSIGVVDDVVARWRDSALSH